MPLTSGNINRIKRHKGALRAIGSSTDEARMRLEELKIAAGEEESTIVSWSEEIENKIAMVDEDIDKLTTFFMEAEQSETDKARKAQLDFEKELIERKFKYHKELEEEAQHAHAGIQDAKQIPGAAKLPKLTVTKFDGTYFDWTRFWNQFTETIDKADMSPVTKFSYLKEFVEPKVRKSIDGLPFSAEGYNRAKSILTERYGKESEIVKACVQDILDLPRIKGTNFQKIHHFYERLKYCVQSLETMGKLAEVKGNVALTIDKLAGIRGDLTGNNDDWKNWDFINLCDALRLWTRRNPLESNIPEDNRDDKIPPKRDPPYWRGLSSQQTRAWVYCEDSTHRGIECQRVTSVDERKRILATKKLCFNCTGAKHHASECNSKISCRHCSRKHHSSICDRQQTREPGMTASHVGKSTVIHPVVVVKVAGYKFRALLDCGASHSYGSSTFLNLTKPELKSSGVRQIAMLMGVTSRIMQEYSVTMSALTGDFSLDVNVTKVEKRELLLTDYPKYKEVLQDYPHLRGVQIEDDDDKKFLPVHLILGANEFAKIRTGERLRVGRRGDPVAEYARFGWTLMSPGTETDFSKALLAVNFTADYERLCALDVLGLADNPTGDQCDVYEEFKEQLTRSSDGRYETVLPWKGDHPSLPSNRDGSLSRLNSLLRRLQRTGMLDKYDAVIREQIEEGVVEKAPVQVTGKEFYLPHRAVVRDNAEATKLRVVYDASARAHP